MSDNIDPNYYQFPNGAEAVDITRYLTSNGGQAVGYIARATRADGLIKGNPIEDLEKARHFINDEIYRLGGDAEPISKLAKEARAKRPSAAEYKAQVALDQGEPHLVTEITRPVKWLSPADECQVAPGWLLKDSNPDHAIEGGYLKQSFNPKYLQWVYSACNKYGEVWSTNELIINSPHIEFPITLVKQKEKK